MGTGYTRNDTVNNIADGNVINASDLDGEFDAVQSAFDAATGHTHDGTTGEGAPIEVTGPAQEYVSTATELRPKANNTYDLGSVSNQWKDLYVDGTANLDTVDIDAGNIDGTTIGAATPAAGTFTTATATTGNITTVNATTVDTTNIEVTNLKAKDGTAAGSIADSTGVVTLASSVLTTTDINGGTIDGVTIGGASAGAGTFTTATATTGNITTVNATTVDSTNVEVTNIKAKDGTASATIADSTGVMTIASSVLTTADINGGTIDGVTLGTNSAVTEAQIDNININGNAITSTDTNGNITLDPDGTGVVAVTGPATVSGNLAVDTDTLFVDAASNEVGIGTTSPGATLEVAGGSSNGLVRIGQLQFKNSSGSYSGGTDGVFIFPFTDSMLYHDNYDGGFIWRPLGVEGMRIDSSANVEISNNLTVNGNTTLGNAATDTVTITADVASNIIPSADNTYDLGSSGSEWKDLYIDGTANIDSLVADTADINGGTIDGTVIGGATPAAGTFSDLVVNGNAYPSAGSLGNRNKIINGAMVTDQRNAGAAVTADSTTSKYPVDRFFGTAQAADGVFTLQQSATVPAGFATSMIATVTTADASIGATQYYLFNHYIEGHNIADLGWGTASAKAITLSFWTRSSLTGTFGGVISNSAQNRSYPFTYSISAADTWEYKTVTIAGDTSGTWLTTNGVGIRLHFDLGIGSTYRGTAGAWAGATYLGATGATDVISTLNATWYITGVQLEAGDTATPFEHRSIGQELALCQRYYSLFRPQAQTPATQFMITPFYYPVQMRAIPTLTQISAGNASSATINSVVADSTSGGYFQINASAAGGYVLNAIYSASAEL